jgi:hypothetical protein
MKATEFVRIQTVFAHDQLVGALKDVTDAELLLGHSATSNAIGAIAAHVFMTADVFFNVLLAGGKPVLFTSGSNQALGIQSPDPRNWDALRASVFKADALRAYAAAVHTSVTTYLATLTDEELDRGIEFLGQPTLVANMIARANWHACLHMGEIAAIKGISGMKGLAI